MCTAGEAQQVFLFFSFLFFSSFLFFYFLVFFHIDQCFFFSPWTLKVPVNLKFSKIFTGTFLRSRALFGQNSRARRGVHGHFFGRFHGHFYVVHGHFSRTFHGSRPLLMFTGTFFPVHGYFFPVHGHIFVNCSRAKKNIHGHFFQNVHGQIFKVHGEKKNTVRGRLYQFKGS